MATKTEKSASAPDTGGRSNGGRELLAEPVVADDVELHEDVVLGLGDALEDRAERGLSVDEQGGLVAGEKRSAG